MDKTIMIGCDLHDENMLLKIAVGRGEPETRVVANTRAGRDWLVRDLQKGAADLGGARVVFAYEASSLGFGLHDELTAAGLTCHVLSPNRIERSPKHRRTKTDEKDAQRILELVRAHVLAGNDLPAIWIPDEQTREDRDLVRARLDVAEKATRVKTQITTLLKRYERRKPKEVGKNWTRGHRAWLETLLDPNRGLLPGSAQLALGSLTRQLEFLEEEIAYLDEALGGLAQTPRYAEPVKALVELKGVQVHTAMVFLCEMGDLRRFANRRQVGSFLGLVPSSHESGERDDRKGHITRQGPSRVRKVLCQATWSRIRWDDETAWCHARIVAKNPKAKKIAVVALMRRLAIRMWHVAREAQVRAGCFDQPSDAEAA
jgi:transposase